MRASTRADSTRRRKRIKSAADLYRFVFEFWGHGAVDNWTVVSFWWTTHNWTLPLVDRRSDYVLVKSTVVIVATD